MKSLSNKEVATEQIEEEEQDPEVPSRTVDEFGVVAWRDKNGLLHRLEGPAVYDDGNENGYSAQWWKHGKEHRVGGPCSIEAAYDDDGDLVHQTERWMQDGKYHREDGPAIDNEDIKQWYLNGVRRKYASKRGSTNWYNDKEQLHREDGPAVESFDGKVKQYYHNGVQVNADGSPIVIKGPEAASDIWNYRGASFGPGPQGATGLR